MRRAYYNEHDPYAAQWLRNLIAAGQIAPGDVDERDIQEVTPDDLYGLRAVSLLRRAWRLLLRPPARRVARRPARLDRTGKKVQVGLEAVAKMAGWATPRHTDGSKHVRTRDGALKEAMRKGRQQRPWDDSELSGLADARRRRDERGVRPRETSGSDRTAESDGDQRERGGADPWRSSRLIPCADGRARRIPQSGILPLADGVPARVGQLRAYGNAVCPEVAAAFIWASRDVRMT